MKVSGKQIFLVVVLITVNWHSIAVQAAQPDFHKALEMVKNAAEQHGNINYAEFCNVKHRGAFKLGCQIRDMPEVGLLVCLESKFCETRLKYGELRGLEIIKNANLNVVLYDPTIINKLKCGKMGGSTDMKCSGFLVKWISADQGKLKSLRTIIKYNYDIDLLVNWVKTIQPNRPERRKTAKDLSKIVKFMLPPHKPKQYNRICDLQGFFMTTGGFAIADPDDVKLQGPSDFTCSDEQAYPTTRKVIKYLIIVQKKLIE